MHGTPQVHGTDALPHGPVDALARLHRQRNDHALIERALKHEVRFDDALAYRWWSALSVMTVWVVAKLNADVDCDQQRVAVISKIPNRANYHEI